MVKLRIIVLRFAILPIILSMILNLAGCNTGQKQTLTLPQARQVMKVSKEIPTTKSQKQSMQKERSLRRKSIKGFTIVVDAGHGGKDPGTLGTNSPLPEKTIVLLIANEVAERLRDYGHHIVTTRTTDQFVELDKRAQLADLVQADLLLSIHVDARKDPRGSGATIYMAHNALSKSEQVAQNIRASFENNGIECLGIRRSNFRVLSKHTRPSVLVECGHLTNWADARKLNTAHYRSYVSAAIVEGVNGYFQQLGDWHLY